MGRIEFVKKFNLLCDEFASEGGDGYEALWMALGALCTNIMQTMRSAGMSEEEIEMLLLHLVHSSKKTVKENLESLPVDQREALLWELSFGLKKGSSS